MSKVERIYLKNIKAIVEQEINLHGCSALITAGNNKGKTTLLTALPQRLLSKKPSKVLHNDEKEGIAEFELTTGEKFLWELKDGKEKLTFITSEGLQKTCVKEISRRYFSMPFDIDKFLNQSPKEQSKALQKLVGVDFDDLDAKFNKAYEERAFLKRRLEESKAQDLKYDDRIPLEKIDISALQKSYAETVQHNEEIRSVKSRIASIEHEIEELRRKAIILKSEQSSLEEELSILGESKAIEDMQANMDEAISKNNYIDNNIRAKEHQNKIERHKSEVEKIEGEVKRIEALKLERLKSVKLPDGVSISDEGLLVDGFEFNKHQLSLSKIYITALKIGALGLGEVKMQFFDAAPLDKVSLLEIEKWASENDLQLLIEKPDFDGGEITYEIIKDNDQ